MQSISSLRRIGHRTAVHDATDEQHTMRRSIALHLLPGVLLLAFFVVVGPRVERLGAPSFLGLMLGAASIILPFEIGVLLYQGKRRNGRVSLEGVVLYREPIPRWHYVALVVPGLAWMVIAFFVIAPPVDEFVIGRWFAWVPDWFFGFSKAPDQYPPSVMLLSVGLALLLNGIAGPLVEELYFRGYLLPRISWLGGWAPLVSGVLFSLYHFFTPWQQLPRLLVTVPLGYLVRWNKNIYWGIVVHCTFNTGCMLLLLASVLGWVPMPAPLR